MCPPSIDSLPTALLREGSWPNLAIRFLLAFVLSGAAGNYAQLAPSPAFTVNLALTTSPAAGQAAVTVLYLTASGFPAEAQVAAADVTVTLEPATSAAGATATTTPSAVTALASTAKRIAFQIPASVQVTVPTAYRVSVAGKTSTGQSFAGGNTSSLTVNPPAKILSVLPASSDAGKTLDVVLTTQYTNFVQGSTQASFGPGISVGAGPAGGFGFVTVTSPTAATARLQIDAAASPGPRDVQVRTGVQAATLAGGFTVTGGVNQPPVVNAGPDQTFTGNKFPATAALNGTVTDDGLPPGGTLTTTWSKVSGPGTVSFANANAPATTATFSLPGSYVLRLTANDSALSASDDLAITADACLSGKEPGVRVDLGAPSSMDAGLVAAPDVIRLTDGRYRMYYIGCPTFASAPADCRIFSAVSTDGYVWTREPGIRIDFGGLDNSTAVAPGRTVQLSNGAYRMYYQAWTAGGIRIFSAVSTDGLNWQKEPGTRIDVGGPFNCVHVVNPDVVQLSSASWRMYFGCGSNPASSAGGRILSAVSTDGLAWSLESGVRLASTQASVELGRPDVRQLAQGLWKMYFQELLTLSGSFPPHVEVRIGSAVSSDGLNWVRDPGYRIDMGHVGEPDAALVHTPNVVPLQDGTFRVFYAGWPPHRPIGPRGFLVPARVPWNRITPLPSTPAPIRPSHSPPIQ